MFRILIICLLAHLLAAPGAEARQPNIIVILGDDLGVNDLSCFGRKDQRTPNLDRLAQQGVRFTSSYSANPVCSPTRAALMSGKDPARLHLTTFLPGRADAPSQLLLHPRIEQQLPPSVRTIADLLRAAGYATACLGKWHLGGKGFLPTDRGFDVYHPGKNNTEPSATEGGKGEYELTVEAEKFMDKNKERPFFLYIPHHTPHIPLKARAELVEKHKDAFNPVYAAMIESMDDCVGRIVAKVEALGLSEDTVIVFTSDNGGLHILEFTLTPATFNRPFRAGKGFLYEGGIRVPAIVRWQGKIPPGRVVDTPVITMDWLPTFLEFAGLAATEQYDGVSLAGLLTRGTALSPRPLYWHFPHYTNQGGWPAGAVRSGDWKLIEHYDDGRLELFNLAEDIGETTDRAAQEPARVAELRGLLEKRRRDIGVQENTANPRYSGALGRQLYRDGEQSRLSAEPTAAAMAPKLQPWRNLMDAVIPRKGKDAAAEPGAGAVILHARDAKVHGKKLRYESPPHKDTLGFWVDASDWAAWDFTAPFAGSFEVEVLQACGKGSAGAEVDVTIGSQKLSLTIADTGHFQRFVPRTIGSVRLDAGPQHLEVRARNKPGPAVMDLRRVVLRAAP